MATSRTEIDRCGAPFTWIAPRPSVSRSPGSTSSSSAAASIMTARASRAAAITALPTRCVPRDANEPMQCGPVSESVEDVYVDTADSDTGPHCMGSFASRGTHRVGNAVMVAAREARAVMMEAAAEELEVDPGDLETDGRGAIRVKGAPHRSIAVSDIAWIAQRWQGKTISGRGIFLVPLSDVDPETGEMSPATCYAHACMIAEVEVDDETGEVAMVRMDSAYELGRALNPRLVEQQLVGGAWMGVSHALYETPEPYYPDPVHGPRDFVEYLMPGPGDICPHDIAVLERPAPDGPFGAKGPGEMCANPVLPAVANAIFNAVGVRIDDLPITPEKVLRAIKAQGGARPQARR